MVSQIRQSIFETNSSSTHVLSVTKMELNPAQLPEKVVIDTTMEFGWEEETYYDTESKISYLWLITDDDNKHNQIKAYITALGINVTVYEKENAPSWDYGYIDHSNEAIGFLNKLLNQPDLFYAFIFNPASFIETGNDNSESLSKYSSENEHGWEEFDPNLVAGDYIYYKGN